MSKKERRKERGRKKLTPFKPAMEFGSICLMRKIESFHVSSHAMTMRTNRFDGRSIPSGKMETDARQRASPHDGSINFHQLPSTSIKFQGDSSREAGSEMSSRKISSSKNNEIGAPIATNLNSIGLIGSDRKDMDICRL